MPVDYYAQYGTLRTRRRDQSALDSDQEREAREILAAIREVCESEYNRPSAPAAAIRAAVDQLGELPAVDVREWQRLAVALVEHAPALPWENSEAMELAGELLDLFARWLGSCRKWWIRD